MAQQSKHVLLVDDDPLIRASVRKYLAAAGYFVREAVDGLDALKKLRAGLPHLIISDLNMPRMSGNEFLDVVRQRFPQIPVIVISEALPDQMPEGLAADAYFHKNGTGLSQLLLTMVALSRMPLPRIASPRSHQKPVQARWDGDGHYTLRCDDCLRELSIPRDATTRTERDWTVCVYCGRLTDFLIPKVDRQGLEQP